MGLGELTVCLVQAIQAPPTVAHYASAMQVPQDLMVGLARGAKWPRSKAPTALLHAQHAWVTPARRQVARRPLHADAMPGSRGTTGAPVPLVKLASTHRLQDCRFAQIALEIRPLRREARHVRVLLAIRVQMVAFVRRVLRQHTKEQQGTVVARAALLIQIVRLAAHPASVT
jgi:hypothetical protein